MKLSIPFLLVICGTFSQISAKSSSRRREQDANGSMQCNVKRINGMVRPGQAAVPTQYICHDTEQIYNLSGDVKSFFEGEDTKSGNIEINVPYSAIEPDGNIAITNNEVSPINVTNRRKLYGTSITGKRKVLVVRVSNDNILREKVEQDEKKLYWDVFGDENNLKKVYKRCSGNKLKFVPATGYLVNRGVITVSPPQSVCGMNFKSVSNHAKAQLVGLNIDTDHFMYIMPDCADFEGAEAWGEMNGTDTWIPSRNGSVALVQVHEVGHNLGLGHSGAEYDDYGDKTCFMGAQVPWDDKGAKMCFNAGKLWSLGWYSKHHGSFKPDKYGVKANLIGIGEAQTRGGAVVKEKVIVKLSSSINKNASHLYLRYNNGKGPNQGVVGDKNKVVITQQYSRSSDSHIKAALGPGETYYGTNWDARGNTLVVKHCGFTKGSWGDSPRLASANIVAYVQGETSKNCSVFGNALVSNAIKAPDDSFPGTSSRDSDSDYNRHKSSVYDDSEPGSCVDIPGFYDAYGNDYNCAWYEQEEFLCTSSGSDVPNVNGLTAANACCTCGGGQYIVT